MKCNLEIMRKEIAVLLPSSHPEGGEATMLITSKGKKILDRRSIRWIIKRLAYLFNVDLRASKKNYGALLGKNRFVPITFSRSLIFIPLTLKTNTMPVNKKIGYISLEHIEGIKKDNPNNIIMLKNNMEIICCNSLKTVENRIREGRIIQNLLQSELCKDSYYMARKDGSSFVAENNWSKEKIALFTAAFLHFWNNSNM